MKGTGRSELSRVDFAILILLAMGAIWLFAFSPSTDYDPVCDPAAKPHGMKDAGDGK
jgi:hypothetical protein